MVRKIRSKKRMWMFVMVVAILVVAVAVFFNIPYSRTKSEFQRVVDGVISNTTMHSDVFSEEDIEDLPLPVQKYFRYCGYLGKPKMSYMKATFKNADFIMTGNKKVKIDYTQYNFVDKPVRFAYIDSSMFGIPFEGLDSYKDGIGSMKGTLAKMFTLFDQRGEDMDKACLVTVLSECLAIPNVALQDYIKWEPVDDTHAKATITYYGTSASGVFTFDSNGALTAFRTSDRVATDMDGSKREADWSAYFEDYQTVNGIKHPRVLRAVWHFPEGDLVYFNENKTDVCIEFK